MRTGIICVIYIIVTLSFMKSEAQDTLNINQVDSISYNLYYLNKWNELEKFGKTALKGTRSKNDTNFINLRLRLGYGNLLNQNYSKALEQYESILSANSQNSTALYYKYLCNSFLNRVELAHYTARDLNDDAKAVFNESSSQIINQIETEEVYKYSNTNLRKPGMFYNLGLNSILNWNLSLSQSFIVYHQNILFPDYFLVIKNIAIDEWQYYAKLSFVPMDNILIKSTYHHLNSKFDMTTYKTDIGELALKYYSYCWDFQFAFDYGLFIKEIQRQFSVQLGLYPFGNLDLYYIIAVINSNRNSQNNLNISNTLGIKLTDFLWLEANYTSNDIFNYLENDILYVYNSIDPGLYKAGGTLICPVSENFKIKFGYLYEPKKLALTKENTYTLQSIYGGLTWKL